MANTILHSVQDLGYDSWVSIKSLPSTFSKAGRGGEETETVFIISEGRVLGIWLKHTRGL